MSDTVLLTDHNGWIELTLNRPDQLNSFNDEMHQALRSKLEIVKEDNNCRAVLLTGAGRGFCAGQDLGDRDPNKMSGAPDLSQTLKDFYNPLIKLIRSIPKPVICAVNGVAAGAGVNIALNCDITIAGEDVKFIQSFSKVGLIPDAGGTWHLPRLLGEARAKALALTATPITGRQAANWGLIWKALPNEQLMQEARDLSQSLAEGPTIGFALTKQAMQQSATNNFEQQLELEAEFQGRAGRTKDYAEGVSAFLEKRAANFTGSDE